MSCRRLQAGHTPDWLRDGPRRLNPRMDDTDLATVEAQVGTKLTPVGATESTSAACNDRTVCARLSCAAETTRNSDHNHAVP